MDKRHKMVECLSVRPFMSPVDRQQHRRPAGLLLRSGAGSRYRSITQYGPRKFRSNLYRVWPRRRGLC